MPRDRPLPFARTDAALLAVTVALAALVVFATDREFRSIPETPLEARPWSRWPDWMRTGCRSLIRPWRDVLALVGTLGSGLAVIAYRPWRTGHPRESGPGRVALAITAVMSLCWVVMDAVDLWIAPLVPLPPGVSWGNGPPAYFYHFWNTLPLRLAWAVAAAWIALALSGGWRPPTDWIERSGRCVGWVWLASFVGHGALSIIFLG